VLQRLSAEGLERLDLGPDRVARLRRELVDRPAILVDGRCAWSAGTPPCTAMARLLVVHHATSPRLQALLEAVPSGAGDGAIQDVTVLARPALATAIDVLGADGYLLGTPANLGYVSGALQHFLGPDRLPLPGGDPAAYGL
jgi:hypothetical protein